MTIDDSLASCPVIEKRGYPYLIHPLTDGIPRVDPELLREWATWAKESPLVAEATVLLAPEAMAIPLAVALSLETALPYLVVRKRAYDLDGERVAYAETGYSESSLHINGLRAGDRVLVIDDVLSTGGTLSGVLATLQDMDVEALGALVFLDKGDVRAGIEERYGVPVAVMRSVRVEAGRVRKR